jgi:protein SCO1/2
VPPLQFVRAAAEESVMRAIVSLSIVVVTVSLMLVLSVVFFGGSSASTTYRGSRPPAKLSLPTFTLVDENGAQVRSEDFAGKAVVVTFLDAQCTDACPIVGGIVAQAVDLLSAEERANVAVLGISVDPAEDTPTAVKQFLAQHHATGKLSYLTAPEPVMEPLWKDFKVLPTVRTGDDSLHSIPVQIYDKEGIWRSTLNVNVDLTARNLAHDIRIAESH